MMKRSILMITVFTVLFYCHIALAQEKPFIIKGLYIGMNVNDARNITEKLFGKAWTISPVGESMKVIADYRFGEDKIFGRKHTTLRSVGSPGFHIGHIIGDRGFAIFNKDYDSYEGFISSDENDCVTRISFSKMITNSIFSAEKIDAEDFAKAFWNNYNMPEFGWIPYGWQYTSPNGYTITIKTDKFIDIKKEYVPKPDPPTVTENKPKSNIKFE